MGAGAMPSTRTCSPRGRFPLLVVKEAPLLPCLSSPSHLLPPLPPLPETLDRAVARCGRRRAPLRFRPFRSKPMPPSSPPSRAAPPRRRNRPEVAAINLAGPFPSASGRRRRLGAPRADRRTPAPPPRRPLSTPPNRASWEARGRANRARPSTSVRHPPTAYSPESGHGGRPQPLPTKPKRPC